MAVIGSLPCSGVAPVAGVRCRQPLIVNSVSDPVTSAPEVTASAIVRFSACFSNAMTGMIGFLPAASTDGTS